MEGGERGVEFGAGWVGGEDGDGGGYEGSGVQGHEDVD